MENLTTVSHEYGPTLEIPFDSLRMITFLRQFNTNYL